jgi:Zn ribbon nucleic-acid-binding protein
MICPICEKGQMIKTNKHNMSLVQATSIKCVKCGHHATYRQIKPQESLLS